MRLRWLTIVLIGVGSLTACAQPEPTATPQPVPEPLPPPAVPTLTRTATPAPTLVPINPASEVQQVSDIFRCDNDANCMDNAAGSLLQTRTTRELLAELDELGKQDRQVLLQCHPAVHAIGRMSYKISGNVGDAFQLCDHTCHSGCFHGTMERVFLPDQPHAEGTTVVHIPPEVVREKVPTVCEPFGFGLEGNIRFQCMHGLGHAVMFFLNYDLVAALNTCDLLPSRWDETSCYGGVFMENVVAVDKSKRFLSSDPHFPCNAIEDKYINDCYNFQTSRMLELGLSYQEIGNECAQAGIYRNICTRSLGRDVSNDARRDPASANTCTNLIVESDRQQCITGLVYALADNSLDGRYAFPYCDNLGDDYTSNCYRTTLSYLITSLYIPETKVIESCETHSSNPDCGEIVSNVR